MNHDTAPADSKSEPVSAPSIDDKTSVDIDPSVPYINTVVTGNAAVSMNAAGQAYQSVANSMALAVENASGNFLNFSTIAGAALAKATENYMGPPQDPTWAPVIANLQAAIKAQADIITTVGTNTSTVMGQYRDLLPLASSTPPSSGSSSNPTKADSPVAPKSPPQTPSNDVPSTPATKPSQDPGEKK